MNTVLSAVIHLPEIIKNVPLLLLFTTAAARRHFLYMIFFTYINQRDQVLLGAIVDLTDHSMQRIFAIRFAGRRCNNKMKKEKGNLEAR